MSCTLISQNDTKIKNSIYKTIDAWHEAAANADFDSYFKLMTEDAVFIGTDATENWQLEEFKEFSKPYFDKGKAWSFTSLERNIYLNSNKNLAWFDEILDTQMGLCRGSGVVVLTENGWKIKHYVLSITIPNPKVKNVVNIKKDTDSLLKQKLKLKTE
ncbi:nuclear transport factor 2 family protein [Mesoflavibacter sp.]|uniref:nuclear transport factor 2 family protein n=1 Tax=Mesoflavibacter sp. TaxID=1930902 RepID=UPI003517A81D